MANDHILKVLFVGGPLNGLVKTMTNPSHVLIANNGKQKARYRLMQGEKKNVWFYVHNSLSQESAYYEIQRDLNLKKKTKQLMEELD